MLKIVVPMALTGVIFLILLSLLIFWLYKDHRSRILACIPCRKFFLRHTPLSDYHTPDSPPGKWKYLGKPVPGRQTSINSVDGDTQDFTCLCQRFKHFQETKPSKDNDKVTAGNVTLANMKVGQGHSNHIDLCQIGNEVTNADLDQKSDDPGQLTLSCDSQKEEGCDVIVSKGCERCSGCPCTPVTVYKNVKHPESSRSNDGEVTLKLTPEITYRMSNECRCGCQNIKQ